MADNEIPRLFYGQVALVSGAGQGLGEHFARVLAAAGCTVAAVDMRREAVEAVARSIRNAGHRAEAYPLDVRDRAACSLVAGRVRETLGPVAVLVNNAGVSTRAQPDADDFDSEIDRVMAVNVKGLLHLTQACVEDLKQTQGAVVNIASIAALLASFASIPYAASKGAVAQATKFLARDLAPFGVRVNALAPGFIVTPLTADLREGSESRMARAAARTMLKRVAEPGDLAGPLLFLASHMSKYLTGVVLPVDGGYSAN